MFPSGHSRLDRACLACPGYPRSRPLGQTSRLGSFVPTTEVRLFNHLVPTEEHLSVMVILAARLAAILLRIARGLRHADKGQPRL
jgi:hypothetical protein